MTGETLNGRSIRVVRRFFPLKSNLATAQAAATPNAALSGTTMAAVSRVSRMAANATGDRKSTRLNSSHGYISYAVFCLKKKKTTEDYRRSSLKLDARTTTARA